jgi:hypothetical protein
MKCMKEIPRPPLTIHIPHPAFEDGPDTGFRNVGKTQSDAGEIPIRTYTIFNKQRNMKSSNFPLFNDPRPHGTQPQLITGLDSCVRRGISSPQEHKASTVVE